MVTFPTTQAFNLSEAQRQMLTHCLQLCIEQWTEQATCDTPPIAYLARQFERQAAEAKALAQRIESADYVRLGAEVTE